MTITPIHEQLPRSVVRDVLLWGSLCVLGVFLAYIMLKPVQLPANVKSDANHDDNPGSASESMEIDVELAISPGPGPPAPTNEVALLSNDLAPAW